MKNLKIDSKFLVKLLVDFITSTKKTLNPPKFASWQTIILAALGVGVASLFVLPFILAIVSFILLIVAVGWYTFKNPVNVLGIPLGSWLVGGLIALFLVAIWGNLAYLPLAFVIWPLASAILVSIPELLEDGLKFRNPSPESRQRLTIFLLVHLLVSCWLLFYFVVQNWVQQYPSISSDNLSKSAFVVRIQNNQSPPPSRGVELFSSVNTRLKNQIDNKIWPDVERWLLDGNKRIQTLWQQSLAERPAQENSLWQFGSTISSIQSGYKIDLLANWNGPSSQQQGYHFKQSCEVKLSRRRGQASGSPVSRSDVQCGDIIRAAGSARLPAQKANR